MYMAVLLIVKSMPLYAIFCPGATAGAQFPPPGQPSVSAVQQISKGQRNGRETASIMSGRMREKNRPYTIGGKTMPGGNACGTRQPVNGVF